VAAHPHRRPASAVRDRTTIPASRLAAPGRMSHTAPDATVRTATGPTEGGDRVEEGVPMPRIHRLAALTLVAILLAPVGAAQAASPAAAGPTPRFHPMACPADVFPPESKVDCGYVTVPEDRAHPGGRTIRVAAAVMHATSRHPAADPIVFLDGGPSFGAIAGFAVDAYFGGTSYAEDHDVVLVDTRGTGLSEPRLGCPEIDEANVTAFYSGPYVNSNGTALMTEAIGACRDRLTGAGIDLASYDSAESAADIDTLRSALGYRTWNLIALSADGVLGLTYMRLFPKAIRSAVIDSGQSPQHLWGLDHIRGLSEELEAIFAGCAANGACNAAYPHLRRVFYDFVERLNAHPATITFPDFQPGPVKLRLDGAGFYLDALFGIFPGNLYAPDSIRPLLSEIWRSAHGELVDVYRERFGTGPTENDHANDFVAMGKTLSYVCRDLVGFIKPADLRKAARDLPAMASIFLDPDYDLADGSTNVISPAGCRTWNVGVAAPVQHKPVRSSIPTLVLAGEYDTGVPPSVVRQVLPGLSRSYYYEFPASAHVQLASYNGAAECARSIVARFLDDPDARPDASCIATLPAFDFTP